jgi:hypothetical protein
MRACACWRRCWPPGDPTYEAVRAEVRGERTPEGTPYLNITRPIWRLRSAAWRTPRRCAYERRDDLRDETLELRLKALRLPSFLEQYLELAKRAAAEGWSHVRYLAELVTQEASDRADRRITRLLLDAKLPKDKSVATLDLNRYEAPLRGRSVSSCGASSSPVRPTSA